jgi:hypothetical protein
MPNSTLPRNSVLDALPPELSSGLFAKAHDQSVRRIRSCFSLEMQATAFTGSKMAC